MKILFSKVSKGLFSPWNILKNIKNQQRSSDLSLINEKQDLVRDPQQNLCHAYIRDYPTKANFKSYEFSVQRLSLNLLFKSEN